MQELDKHQYPEEELIEVKVPLHMPYMISWSDYERVDGAIEIDGAWYNYVKRKVSNDTLYLKCVPNTGKTKLYRSRNDYAQQANGTPGQENGKDAASKKSNILPEYNPPVLRHTICTPIVYLCLAQNRQPVDILNDYYNDAWRPPRQPV